MVELIDVGTETKPQLVDPRGHPKGYEHTLTTPGSHVAHKRGYVNGHIVEPGEPVDAGVPVAEEWMEEAPKAPKGKGKTEAEA